MFIKRKWARMGGDRKLYLKVCSVVLMAILVLFFHSWNRKQHLKLKQNAAMLDVNIQELIQTGTFDTEEVFECFLVLLTDFSILPSQVKKMKLLIRIL